MKLRDGHVSNSSSSSFVMILKKKDYKDLLSRLGKMAHLIAERSSWENLKQPGLVMVSIWSGMDGEDQLDALGVKDQISKADLDADNEESDKGHEEIYDAEEELQEALKGFEDVAIYSSERDD